MTPTPKDWREELVRRQTKIEEDNGFKFNNSIHIDIVVEVVSHLLSDEYGKGYDAGFDRACELYQKPPLDGLGEKEARQAELSRVIGVIEKMPYTGYSEDIDGNRFESVYKCDIINKLKNNV